MTYWHTHFSTTEKGVIGTVTSLGSSAFSMLPHLETTLRVAGLCVGLAVGIVTLISVLHDLRKKQKELKK
jgi:zinc transporter ZupT